MGVTGTRALGRRRAPRPGRAHPRRHRPAGLRRARRLQRRPGGRGRRLRRRRHRRLGLRARACSTRRTRRPASPRSRTSPPSWPTACAAAVTGPARALAGSAAHCSLLLLAGCADGSGGTGEAHRQRRAGLARHRRSPTATRCPADVHRHRRRVGACRPTLAAAPVTLVFFGYTHCPDICNVVLANIASALRGAEPAVRDDVRLLFVTTDPARDKPAGGARATSTGSTRAYDGLVAPVGDDRAAAQALDISYESRTARHGGGYEVDHGTYTTGFVDGEAQRRLVGRHQRSPTCAPTSPGSARHNLTVRMTSLSIPSPSEGVWHLGPLPVRAYALCIIAGIVVAVWLGERRWVARGGRPGDVTEIATWMVPFGIIGGRIYHVITTPQRVLRRRRRPVKRSTSGRAASASGARSPSAASAPGSAAAAAASRCRRSPTRSRRASRSRRRSAGSATTSTRSCTAGRPTCRGAWRSTPRTGRTARWTRRPTTRPSCTSRCGTSASRRWSSGPTGGSSSATAGPSRSTSRPTPSAGSGSRTCASTRPTTSSACGSTTGPASGLPRRGRLLRGLRPAASRPRDARGARGPSGATDAGTEATTEAADAPTSDEVADEDQPASERRPRRGRRQERAEREACASSTSTPTSPAAGCGPRCSAPPTAWCPTSR